MQMRAWNFLAVRIRMRWPPIIEPGQDDDLAGTVLHCALPKIESCPRDIQKELLAPALRFQGDVNGTPILG